MAKSKGTEPKATPRESLKTLRADLDKLTSRVTAAKSATSKSTKAMEESLALLSLKVDSASGIELRDYASQLTSNLRAQMDAAQKEINAHLAAQLANPKLDRLETAITRANARLKDAEVAQAQAISKVNQHIARLAAALDQRIQTQSRELSEMRSDLSARIDQSVNTLTDRVSHVESQSADALLSIGEKVSDLSAELTRRMDQLEGSIAERVYETALDAQHDLEQQKSKLDRRIEQIEETQRNTLAPVQQSLATVFARLEAVEAGMSAAVQSAPAGELPPMPQSAAPEPEHNLDDAASAPASLLSRIGLGKSAAATEPDDAFAPPKAREVTAPIAPPAPKPRPAAQTASPAYAQYDSQAIAPNPYAQNPYGDPGNAATAYAQNPYAEQGYEQPAPSNPYGSPAALQSYAAQAFEQGSADPYGQGQPYPVEPALTFEEDALYPIEEAAQSMQAARPGASANGSGGNKKQLLRTAITAAALIGVVSAGAIFAKNRFLGGADNTPPSSQSAQSMPIAQGGEIAAQNPDMPEVIKTEPTGQMSQPEAAPAQALNAPVRAPEALKAAVESGNPIAQLQYGLSQLRAGNAEDGAAYVRQAASQGLPMAQYILSHLYDTGDGVTRDPKMARDLAKQAAQGGHRVAMYDLAVYYVDDAESGAMDAREAMGRAAQWFQKAAEFGMTDAQYNLAVLYDQGNGVASDPAEAYVWYAIAGQQGDQESAAQAQNLRGQLSGKELERADAKIAAFKPAQINAEANGVFGPQPWDKPARQVNAKNVEVQKLLTALGYDIGAPDGIIGAKSRAAIADFERANGMSETGQVSDPLLTKLRSAANG